MKFSMLPAIVIALAITTPAKAQDADCRHENASTQIRLCDEVIEGARDDGTKSAGYLYRCQAHDVMRAYDLAIADCTQALKLNPNDNSIHNSLSIIFQNLLQFDEAIASSNRAIEGNPNNGSYYNTRSNAYCGAKNFEASVADRMQAMKQGLYTGEQMQAMLKRRGLYDGEVGGAFGETSLAALRAWTENGC